MDEHATKIGLFILAGIQVLTLFSLFYNIWWKASNRPERREVSFRAQAADRKEFEKHAADNAREHKELFNEIASTKESLRREIKEDDTLLHEKINTVAREVSGLAASQESQTALTSRMDAKLDNIASKLNANLSPPRD